MEQIVAGDLLGGISELSHSESNRSTYKDGEGTR